MAKVLVVVRGFGDFSKGDRIRDQELVGRYAVSHPRFVRVIDEAEVSGPSAAPETPKAS